MTRWQVCHQSGRVLFTTNNEVTARNREQFGWKVIEVDNRYELASQHGMSKEYIDWFFDKMKHGCGNQWFIMMAAMWEGWKGALDSEPVAEIVERLSDAELTKGRPYPYLRGKLAMERMPIGTKFYAVTPANDIANGIGTE